MFLQVADESASAGLDYLLKRAALEAFGVTLLQQQWFVVGFGIVADDALAVVGDEGQANPIASAYLLGSLEKIVHRLFDVRRRGDFLVHSAQNLDLVGGKVCRADLGNVL